jgi:hypothetical protein
VIGPDSVEREDDANDAQCVGWGDQIIEGGQPEEYALRSEGRVHHCQTGFSFHKWTG